MLGLIGRQAQVRLENGDARISAICPLSEYLRQKAAGFSGGRGSSDG
jgi:hypothetical protein